MLIICHWVYLCKTRQMSKILAFSRLLSPSLSFLFFSFLLASLPVTLTSFTSLHFSSLLFTLLFLHPFIYFIFSSLLFPSLSSLHFSLRLTSSLFSLLTFLHLPSLFFSPSLLFPFHPFHFPSPILSPHLTSPYLTSPTLSLLLHRISSRLMYKYCFLLFKILFFDNQQTRKFKYA